jgi:hypothetical protein
MPVIMLCIQPEAAYEIGRAGTFETRGLYVVETFEKGL